MTPLNYNFFNTCYWHDVFHCMNFKIIYQPWGQLPYQGSVCLEKKPRKKTITEGAFFFPFFLKPISLYHSLL